MVRNFCLLARKDNLFFDNVFYVCREDILQNVCIDQGKNNFLKGISCLSLEEAELFQDLSKNIKWGR